MPGECIIVFESLVKKELHPVAFFYQTKADRNNTIEYFKGIYKAFRLKEINVIPDDSFK